MTAIPLLALIAWPPISVGMQLQARRSVLGERAGPYAMVAAGLLVNSLFVASIVVATVCLATT